MHCTIGDRSNTHVLESTDPIYVFSQRISQRRRWATHHFSFLLPFFPFMDLCLFSETTSISKPAFLLFSCEMPSYCQSSPLECLVPEVFSREIVFGQRNGLIGVASASPLASTIIFFVRPYSDSSLAEHQTCCSLKGCEIVATRRRRGKNVQSHHAPTAAIALSVNPFSQPRAKHLSVSSGPNDR